jgi:hypothetical protein
MARLSKDEGVLMSNPAPSPSSAPPTGARSPLRKLLLIALGAIVVLVLLVDGGQFVSARATFGGTWYGTIKDQNADSGQSPVTGVYLDLSPGLLASLAGTGETCLNVGLPSQPHVTTLAATISGSVGGGSIHLVLTSTSDGYQSQLTFDGATSGGRLVLNSPLSQDGVLTLAAQRGSHADYMGLCATL